MKSYFAPQQFCLVGKAWEVKYYLRNLSINSSKMQQPLTRILNEKTISLQPNKANPFVLVSSKEV
jgi:hypothetical protein